MKKAIAIPLAVFTFILGIALSDFIMQGINGIFDANIETKAGLRDKLDKTRKDLEDSGKKLEEAGNKYDQLADSAARRQANLDNLIKDIDTKVNASVVKDILLTTPSSQTDGKGQIFLNPSGTEALLEPTTTGDATVDQFKNSFNKKAKEILDVSKGIMKEKIGRLNQEVLRINDELKDRNVQLIGKLREEKKYKNQINKLNTDLKSTNEQLTDKNEQLSAKLKEVEKYKKELEQHKKYINDLESIKGDLQKTVGVLETKIENGRLKVSFKGDILFESGEHALRKEGVELLNSVIPILSKSMENNDIFVAGHTDNVPIREDAKDRYDSNWVLSAYRAIEVVKYMMGKGMDPQKLTAAGYGEYKPISDNATPEGKAKNRRVELFLIPKIIQR